MVKKRVNVDHTTVYHGLFFNIWSTFPFWIFDFLSFSNGREETLFIERGHEFLTLFSFWEGSVVDKG